MNQTWQEIYHDGQGWNRNIFRLWLSLYLREIFKPEVTLKTDFPGLFSFKGVS